MSLSSDSYGLTCPNIFLIGRSLGDPDEGYAEGPGVDGHSTGLQG